MTGLSDGLGSSNRVRKKSALFCWSRGEIDPAELSRCYPCLCIVALGTRALQKPFLVFSTGLCTITWNQKDSGVFFRKCFALHYQKEMGPIFLRSESSEFWDLVIRWEQGVDPSKSKFGSPKGQTAGPVSQNLPERYSWLVSDFF